MIYPITEPGVYVQIPGYESYYITKDGRVFSRLKRVGQKRGIPPKWVHGDCLNELIPNVDKLGYSRVRLYRNGVSRNLFVSRLVLLTFARPPLPYEQACHNDGNPRNNNIANLRWGTAKDNSSDTIKHGKSTKGTRNGMCKLDESIVEKIRSRYAKGETQLKIAEDYNVSRGMVGHIVRGMSWRHSIGGTNAN